MALTLSILISILIIATLSVFSASWGGVMLYEIKKIEEVSGADFCGSGEIIDIDRAGDLNLVRSGIVGQSPKTPRVAESEIRAAVLANFPARDASCIDLGLWPESQEQTNNFTLSKVTGSITIEESRIPLILTRRVNGKINADKFDGRIFIRLSGGPGGIPIGVISDFTIPMRNKDILIDFLYAGSGTNLLYPEPNFRVAVNQINSFLRSLRSRNPDAEIIVVGESLGGVLALESLGNTVGITSKGLADKVVLISPLARSVRSFIKLSSDLAAKESVDNLFEIYRVIDSKEDDWSTGHIRRLNQIDVLSKFFPVDALNDEISERIDKIESKPVLLIYGSEDPVIGISELEGLAGRKFVTLERVDGMKHFVSNLGHIEAMRYAIHSFLD
jgi:pimeloyl-ACP methyl ester carboxylesterase